MKFVYLFLLSFFVTNSSFSEECGQIKQTGNKLLFYGDTHGYYTHQKLVDMIRDEYYSNDFSLLIHLGDIKNHGEKSLDQFFNKFDFLTDSDGKFIEENRTLFVLGNHDYAQTQKKPYRSYKIN